LEDYLMILFYFHYNLNMLIFMEDYLETLINYFIFCILIFINFMVNY
jgi:hypothetical protein